MPTGRVARALGQHDQAVTALDFTPNGETLISSSDDGTTILWDTASRTVRETLSGHAGSVHSQVLTGDGSTLYTGSFDTTVLAYDLTGRSSFVRTFQAAETDGEMFAFNLAVSPDSRTAAIGDTSATAWQIFSFTDILLFATALLAIAARPNASAA